MGGELNDQSYEDDIREPSKEERFDDGNSRGGSRSFEMSDDMITSLRAGVSGVDGGDSEGADVLGDEELVGAVVNGARVDADRGEWAKGGKREE